MKLHRLMGSLILGTLLTGWILSCQSSSPEQAPNIIIILADDLGIGDPQVYNPDSKIPTSHINELARSGMRFTDAHSPSSVCTPTRYGLLTGRYAWRTELTNGVLLNWDRPLISPKQTTIATMLKATGYRTAALGKWHLGWLWPGQSGEFINETLPIMPHNEAEKTPLWQQVDFSNPMGGGPLSVGFDYYFGDDVPNFAPYGFIENDGLLEVPDGLKPDSVFGRPGPMVSGWDLWKVMPTITEKAIRYIEDGAENRSPFFLYFALTAPHTPIVPAAAFQGKSGAGAYGDYVCQVDYTVGEVVAALKRSGQLENTVVIFTSDNGSPQRDGTAMSGKVGSVKRYGHNPGGPYRGTKADIWEGGHRVPFIVSWPGKIPKGSVNGQLFGLNDVIATLAGIIGATPESRSFEDSRDFSKSFLGLTEEAVRKDLVHHSVNGSFAIRQGDWKLILTKGSGGWSPPPASTAGEEPPPVQLYNLTSDPAEQNNLQAEHPEIVKELSALLEQYKSQGFSNPHFKK